MKKILSVTGIAALLLCSSAFADPTNIPMQQGLVSVQRNIARNPDNEGLQNARDRIIENAVRQESRGRNHAPGQQRIEGVERVERVERPDRIERVDFATRFEIDRAHRPDRPQRNGRR